MIVMPSIDLEDGRVVKRVRGVRGTGLVIGDPRRVAEELARHPIEWVHVVDLSGAEAGKPIHLHVVRMLAEEYGFRVQFGGGVRSVEHVEEAVSAGAERVVIGTAWTRSPRILEEASMLVGEWRVVAAVDARGDEVLVDAWRRGAGIPLEEAVSMLERLRHGGYLYTCVDAEGLMGGACLERAARLRNLTRRYLAYAGGISGDHDLSALRSVGVDAAVVGMAFYRGAVSLAGWRS